VKLGANDKLFIENQKKMKIWGSNTFLHKFPSEVGLCSMIMSGFRDKLM